MKAFMRVLWILGLIFWALFFALGFNYSHPGSLTVSIILLVAVLGLLGTDIFLLNKWANPDYMTNRQTAKLKEYLALVLFVVLIGCTVYYVAFFVNVHTSVRSKVQAQAHERIENVTDMLSDASVSQSYQAYVDNTSKLYAEAPENAGKSSVVAISEIAEQLKGRTDDPDSYDKIRDGAGVSDDGRIEGKSLNRYYLDVANWGVNPWTITTTLEEIDKNTTKWVKTLTERSSSNPWVSSYDKGSNATLYYTPDFPVESDLLSQVTNPKEGTWGVLSIVTIVILVFLMFFPYIKDKDWSRRGPVTATGIDGIGVYGGKKK